MKLKADWPFGNHNEFHYLHFLMLVIHWYSERVPDRLQTIAADIKQVFNYVSVFCIRFFLSGAKRAYGLLHVVYILILDVSYSPFSMPLYKFPLAFCLTLFSYVLPVLHCPAI